MLREWETGRAKAELVEAIEQRDPTTSGHSRRVADMTVELAKAVERCDAGPYQSVTWSPDDLTERLARGDAIAISATRGTGIPALLERIDEALPPVRASAAHLGAALAGDDAVKARSSFREVEQALHEVEPGRLSSADRALWEGRSAGLHWPTKRRSWRCPKGRSCSRWDTASP